MFERWLRFEPVALAAAMLPLDPNQGLAPPLIFHACGFAWLLRLAILVHGLAALAHYAQESDLLMHGPPIPPPALKFLAPSAMPHDTPQKRRLLSLCVFQAMARVVAAYEGATNPAVARIAALAYASDAAAFLTEAYVHPGPQ